MVTFTAIYAICSNFRVKCTGLEKITTLKMYLKIRHFSI